MFDKKKPSSLHSAIPNWFDHKNISIGQLSEKLGSHFQMKSEDTWKVVKELKEQGIADYQKNKGKLIFR